MGYRYLWQMDDDSRLVQPMGFDLAAHMAQRGLLMASKRTQHDPGSVTAGNYGFDEACLGLNFSLQAR